MMNQIAGPVRTQESSLRDIYYLLFRHTKKVVFTFIGVVVLVTLGTFMLPEIYQSDAKLLVKLGRESVTLDPTASTGQIITTYQSREQEINSEIEILRSRELAEEIVDSIGVTAVLTSPDEKLLGDTSATGKARDTLRKTRTQVRSITEAPARMLAQIDLVDDLAQREQAVLALMRNLRVDPQKNSNIISVTYEARSAMMANLVVSTLIEAYLNKHIKVHATAGSFEFFTEQTDELKNDLGQTEQTLTDLKKKVGIASLEEQRSNLLKRITSLEQEGDSNSSDLAASQARVRALESLINDLPNLVENQRVAGNEWMNQDLYRLKLQEQELLSQYTEDSREVREIRRQIEEATRALTTQSQSTFGSSSTYLSLQQELLIERARVSSLESRSKELASLLAGARAELNVITDNEAQLAQLELKRALQEENYKKYYGNLEQSRIDEELQKQKLSNISVIQEATQPMKPVRPNKLLNIALGFVLAFFAGISLAFFAEFIDHSIKTQEDVEQRLQLPTLIAIPELEQNLQEF
jgi:uncharacterized protein involved in exopolysaccharide biosynthesis